MDVPAALQKIVEGSDLSQAEAAAVFHSIMSGDATPAQTVSYTHLTLPTIRWV